jgi:hypothetical protein
MSASTRLEAHGLTRQRGARAHQLAKLIARRTGLDMDAARRAAEIQLGYETPNFANAKSPDGASWSEDGRYARWLWPTCDLSNRGTGNTPSKSAARSRQY